jgi:hypothetical protein
MRLPVLTDLWQPVAERRPDIIVAIDTRAVSPQSMGTLGGCQERCFDGWCIQCCAGAPCVTYPDPHGH